MTQQKGNDASKKSTTLLEILKRIPEKSFITQKELQKQLKEFGINVQTRTMQRYLDQIVANESFNVEIDTRSRPYGYKKKGKMAGFETQALKPAECLLLKLAQSHMRYLMPPKISQGLTPIFDEAAAYLAKSNNSSEKDWLEKVAFVSGSLAFEPPRIRGPVFDAVSEALFTGSVLEIKYQAVNKNEAKKYRVHPLGLVQQDIRVYLVCRFDEHEDVRTLALHRISDARISMQKAVPPKGFNFKKYVKHDQSFNFDRNRWIRLSFTFTNPETARVLEETPFLGREQTLEKIPGKKPRWRLTAIVRDSRLIDGWLGMWKKDAGIIDIKQEEVKDYAVT